MKYRRNVITIGTERTAVDCINALDYPALIPDDKWVLWVGRGKWPEADRRSLYISKNARHALYDFYLLTPQYRFAQRFDSEAEAQAFLAAENKKRQSPGIDAWTINVTTIEQLKVAMAFYVENDS